jgi:acyl-CoA thioester hydrolase
MAEPIRFESAGLEFCCAAKPEPHMVDYNGHLNVAYYGILFEDAARVVFSRIDLSSAYRERSDCALFAVELHTIFHREVPSGETVSIFCRILDFDGRKVQCMFFMVNSAGQELAAAQEILFVHVDLLHRRASPVPEPQAGRIRGLLERHRTMPEPPEKGRHVGQRKHRIPGAGADTRAP